MILDLLFLTFKTVASGYAICQKSLYVQLAKGISFMLSKTTAILMFLRGIEREHWVVIGKNLVLLFHYADMYMTVLSSVTPNA